VLSKGQVYGGVGGEVSHVKVYGFQKRPLMHLHAFIVEAPLTQKNESVG